MVRFENSRKQWEDFKVTGQNVVLETETPIDNLLTPSNGSRRCGIFEIQCEEGIVRHAKYMKIDGSTFRKRANILFKTWEQMETEEKTTGEIVWSNEDSINNHFEVVKHDIPSISFAV